MRMSSTVRHLSAIRPFVTAAFLLSMVLGPALTASAVVVQSRETRDINGNGYVDAVRMVTDAALNDNFAGFWTDVVGYTIVGYDTGPTANDNEFFVRMCEGVTPDTAATPGVQVVVGGSLGLPVDPAPVTSVDRAKPVLKTAWCVGTVGPNDPVFLKFSEAVSSNSALANDFGLPVIADSYGPGATVAGGQNPIDPSVVMITLGANPVLTPNGLYGPGAQTPGSPSGIYVFDGTRVMDAAANAALNQTLGTAVDLGFGPLVPEPSTWALLLVGGAAVLVWRKARARS